MSRNNFSRKAYFHQVANTVTISELGSSNHNMVLFKPKAKNSVDTGCVTRLIVRCMGPNEKATFNMALSAIKWEPLFRLDSCADQYSYYQNGYLQPDGNMLSY